MDYTKQGKTGKTDFASESAQEDFRYIATGTGSDGFQTNTIEGAEESGKVRCSLVKQHKAAKVLR